MVSLVFYPCFCKETNCLEVFKSQKDEQFIRCKAKKCGFFTRAEDLNEYTNIFKENVRNEYKHPKQPLCNHREIATLLLSKTKENPGRGFFKCAQYQDYCKYFQWCDESPSKTTLANWEPVRTAEIGVQTDEPKEKRKATKTTEVNEPEKKKRKTHH